MQTVSYTDTDRIRSVLGVDDQDLNDAKITDRDLEKELRLDLLSWVPTHAALYSAGESIDATDAARSTADALTLYSTYYCAILVARSLQLAAPQSISDGKNSINRFAGIDWQALIIYLQERGALYKILLQDLTATATESIYHPFTGIGLTNDPVVSG